MKKTILLISMLLIGGSAAKAAFINDPAPEFTLNTLEGKKTSLSDYKGELVFINFWASWCPPCKQEFPEINELANEYKGQGLHVLAINLDKSPDRVEKYLEKIKVNPDALVILSDPDAKVVADYVARSMPSSFIVDGKGIIRFVHFGYGPKDPIKWREEIESLRATVKK